MLAKVKKAIRLTVLSLLIAVICLALPGCDDLGNYIPGSLNSTEQEQIQAYYDTFGTVQAIHYSNTEAYNVKTSLYSSDTKNTMSWNTDNGEIPVVPKDYIYIAIPVLREFSIDSIALFFKAESFSGYDSFDHSKIKDFPDMESSLSKVSMFLLDSMDNMPKLIRRFGDPETEIIEKTENGKPVLDQDGNPITIESFIEYDDPDNPIATADIVYQKNSWQSFLIESWETELGKVSTLTVSKNNVILLRFENNTGYARGAATRVFFTFIDLLVRAA